jgi:hypothetical protein
MFAVKGGTVDVMLAAHAAAGPIERLPLTIDSLRPAAQFTLQRFLDGCARLFRPYLALGFGLMLVYGLSVAAYLAFVLYGYRAMEGRVLILGWTFIAAIATGMLGVWITVINSCTCCCRLQWRSKRSAWRRAPVRSRGSSARRSARLPECFWSSSPWSSPRRWPRRWPGRVSG